MPRYVDGFVIPIPKKNLAKYRALAKVGATVWKEHGALEYIECVSEDAKPGFGLPFPKLTKCKPGEVVVFSWIVYKSRAHRDRVNKKVMQDQRLLEACGKDGPPFDVTRMAWGGFESIVEA